MRNTFMKGAALLALAVLSASALAQAPAGGPPAGGPPRGGGFQLVPLLIESKAFEDGGIVPLKFSFYGANTSQGFTVTAMIRLRLPGDWSSGETPPVSASPSFEEKTDRYDQHLFDQSNPDEIDPTPKGNKVDKMLKDTEKQLERKDHP